MEIPGLESGPKGSEPFSPALEDCFLPESGSGRRAMSPLAGSRSVPTCSEPVLAVRHVCELLRSTSKPNHHLIEGPRVPSRHGDRWISMQSGTYRTAAARAPSAARSDWTARDASSRLRRLRFGTGHQVPVGVEQEPLFGSLLSLLWPSRASSLDPDGYRIEYLPRRFQTLVVSDLLTSALNACGSTRPYPCRLSLVTTERVNQRDAGWKRLQRAGSIGGAGAPGHSLEPRNAIPSRSLRPSDPEL